MNEHWPRWIFASVAKYFEDNISVHLHVDGDERTTDNLSEWVELYLDGPNFDEICHDVFKVELAIYATICVVPTSSTYRRHVIVGDVASLYVSIPLYKYGDDESSFGCLVLDGTPITIQNLPVPEGINIHKTLITGHYKMEIINAGN